MRILINSYFTFHMFKNNFAIIVHVHATNLRHFGAFLVCLMTFLMKVYHAMYQYFLLDAFSMNDVNKADMTEKESKVNFQVKRSIRL